MAAAPSAPPPCRRPPHAPALSRLYATALCPPAVAQPRSERPCSAAPARRSRGVAATRGLCCIQRVVLLSMPLAHAAHSWIGAGAPQKCKFDHYEKAIANKSEGRLYYTCGGEIQEPEISFVSKVPTFYTQRGYVYMGTHIDMNMTVAEVLANETEAAASSLQMLIGFGRTFTPCAGDSGLSPVEKNSKVSVSLLCFPQGSHNAKFYNASLMTTVITSVPLRLDLMNRVWQQGDWVKKPSPVQSAHFGGPSRGDTKIFPFMIKDEHAALERLTFEVKSTALLPAGPQAKEGELIVHAFVFDDKSPCIRDRITQGGCANPTEVMRCLQSYDVGFAGGDDTLQPSSRVGQHTTFIKRGTLTLSAATTPQRRVGRWFVLFACESVVKFDYPCPETVVTLATQAESGVNARVFEGAMGMIIVPLLALVLIDTLYWSAYHGLKSCHENTDKEERFSRFSSGCPDMGFWQMSADTLQAMCNPKIFFTPLLALMVGVFISTAGQFVATHWGLMERTGNRDVCYYNEECYYPSGSLSIPINHMLSHIPYFTVGFYVMFKASFAEYRCDKCLGPGAQERLDLSAFYTIAGSFMAEGIGSAFYHVCPSVETFQFDTCFMIPIAHLLCGALAHWPDSEVTQMRVLKYFLFVLTPIWMFNFVGTWYDVGIIGYKGWQFVVYCIFAISVMIWTFFCVKGIDYLFIQPEEPLKAVGKCLKNVVKAAVVVGLSLSVLWPHFRQIMGGMANTFLLLSVVVMIAVIGWQVHVLELKHLNITGCVPAMRTLIRYSYLPIMGYVTVLALQCFANKVARVDPGVSPAQSHLANQACVVSIFDLHDIWHGLGAIGLALTAKLLLDVRMHTFARTSTISVHSEYSEWSEMESCSSASARAGPE